MAHNGRTTDLFGSAILSQWRKLRKTSVRINLALQGGGSHGAFTWGVLDAILADSRIEMEGLSGSSAGALNAVLLADGWLKGGRDGARKGLHDFWTDLGAQMPYGMVLQGDGESPSLSPVSRAFIYLASNFSPRQLNPFELSPLRDMLNNRIDFDRLRSDSPFKLFVGATQANTGKLRVFREHEITTDVLMASTCLPRLHHAVTIEGQPYWDGGYSANPPVSPLLFSCNSSDIVLVLLSPLERKDCGAAVEAIQERIAEITFSSNLLREMAMITQSLAHARPSMVSGGSLDRRLRNVRFHMVDSSGLAVLQESGSKLLAHAPFMNLLKQQGSERANQWLATDFEWVGKRTSIDLEKCFG